MERAGRILHRGSPVECRSRDGCGVPRPPYPAASDAYCSRHDAVGDVGGPRVAVQGPSWMRTLGYGSRLANHQMSEVTDVQQ
jgi:hypothetical protein